MERDSKVLNKAKEFAIAVVEVYKLLQDRKELVMSRQLLRCGTSIGANITEALNSITRKEFLAKMYIALKESAESDYWIDLLTTTGYLNPDESAELLAINQEIRKMLSSITKTTSQSLQKTN